MKKNMAIVALMCALTFQVNAQTCNWNELIGKKLVLSRWGNMMDGFFLDYFFTNTYGEKPMEQLVLTDSTHFEWKYSLSGDFSYVCTLKGNVMEFDPPFWQNSHITIFQRKGNVILTNGEDGIIRVFYIQEDQPAPQSMPASCINEKGVCDGKLDDLIPKFIDFTYHEDTPMGRHFLFCLPGGNEEKKWLESTEEFFTHNDGTIKPFDVNLYPNGKPVTADVNHKELEDYNVVSVLASMAYLYPEFIRSIIHQESPESFRVDMFDPMGKPIVVRVSNHFLFARNGQFAYCAGKDDQPNWSTILEKAAAKWTKVYQHIYHIEGCFPEMITPMFTGDGRSFCVKPGRLSSEDLSRVINTCLQHGMMINGGFLKADIPLDGHKTEVMQGHSFLPPQKTGALYAIRNPQGKGDDDHIMNVMPTDKDVPPLIDIRVISPGAAAKYFGK